MSSPSGILDELERDLGQPARLRVLANAGGQRRAIPKPAFAERSKLVHEFGAEIVHWLSGRFGGEEISFPSMTGGERERGRLLIEAAVLEAGLTDPTRSANDIAGEFGVTERYIYRVRRDLRGGSPSSSPDTLPLFSKL